MWVEVGSLVVKVQACAVGTLLAASAQQVHQPKCPALLILHHLSTSPVLQLMILLQLQLVPALQV
jgi:hypothetical protein